MEITNRLQEMLLEMGIRSLVPTDDLLNNKLGGMSLIRFNKLMNNSVKIPISLTELELLAQWLSDMTNREVSVVDLLSKKEVTA